VLTRTRAEWRLCLCFRQGFSPRDHLRLELPSSGAIWASWSSDGDGCPDRA